MFLEPIPARLHGSDGHVLALGVISGDLILYAEEDGHLGAVALDLIVTDYRFDPSTNLWYDVHGPVPVTEEEEGIVDDD